MSELTEATTYFTTHLDNSIWTAAADPVKTAALTTAEAEINALPLRSTIPEETKNKAIFEQAMFRLKYSDKRESLQAQGVKSVSVSGGASESYAKLMFGISVAPRAKMFLIGWFAVGAIR